MQHIRGFGGVTPFCIRRGEERVERGVRGVEKGVREVVVCVGERL